MGIYNMLRVDSIRGKYMNEIKDKDIVNTLSDIRNKIKSGYEVTGSEFGLFEYHNESQEAREQKWIVITYMIDAGKIKPEDIGMMFQNNPFFYDWYKRNIMSDVPIPETYH